VHHAHITFVLVAKVCVRNANMKQNKDGDGSVLVFSNMIQYNGKIEIYNFFISTAKDNENKHMNEISKYFKLLQRGVA